MKLAQTLLSLFLFIVLVGSLLVSALSFAINRIEGDILKDSVSTQAAVLSVTRESSDKNNYLVLVEFQTASGEVIQTRVNDGSRTTLREGDTAIIYYRTINPEAAVLESRYKATKLMDDIGVYAVNAMILAFGLMFLIAFMKKREVQKF